MDERPPDERAAHGVDPATARAGIPSAPARSMSFGPRVIERSASTHQRIRFLNAPSDLSPYPAQVGATTHCRGVEVIEEVRR